LSASLTRIPPGLARLRKRLPPSLKIIESKKTEGRKRAKERLLRELKEDLAPRS
jgi:hypothetical protein